MCLQEPETVLGNTYLLNMKNRDIYWRRYSIQGTLYIGQWYLIPFKDLTQLSQLPSAALSCFPESHRQSEISSVSKVIFILEKARSWKVPNLSFREAKSPVLFDVLPKHSSRDVMHEWACCPEAASHQLPMAAAFWIIQIVSAGECSSLTQNLMQMCCSTHLLILMWQPHSTHAHSMAFTTPTD